MIVDLTAEEPIQVAPGQDEVDALTGDESEGPTVEIVQHILEQNLPRVDHIPAGGVRILTPRIQRVARQFSVAHGVIAGTLLDFVAAAGIDSVMAMNVVFDSGAEFVGAADPDNAQIDNIRLLSHQFWEACDREVEHILDALARIQVVASRFDTSAKQITKRASTQLALADKAVKLPQPGARRSGRTSGDPAASMQGTESRRLEDAVQLAFALVDEVGQRSARVRELQRSILPLAEQRSVLRNLFLHKVRVAETLLGHIRAIQRLQTCCAGKVLIPWTLTPVEIAFFLRDAAAGKRTVPRTLLAGMEWLNAALVLPWQLTDSVVVATARMSSREAVLDFF